MSYLVDFQIIQVIDVRDLSQVKNFESAFSEVFVETKRIVKVANKIDLTPNWSKLESDGYVFVSLKTGQGKSKETILKWFDNENRWNYLLLEARMYLSSCQK